MTGIETLLLGAGLAEGVAGTATAGLIGSGGTLFGISGLTGGALLSGIGTAAGLASTISGASSQASQGKAAEQLADYQAKQLEKNANEARAASQRTAAAQRKAGDIAAGNATAAIAASGGSLSDPSAVDIMGNIGAESEIRSINSLWEGDQQAIDLEEQANLKRYEGRSAKQAGIKNAFSSGIAGVGKTLLQKYGG